VLRPLIAGLVMFALFIVVSTVGATAPVDLFLGRTYWLPITSLQELPNLSASLVRLFLLLPFPPFILLVVAGLLSLLEME
jgi:hypothetical protein